MSVLEENERYYSDSHWFGWIGPRVAQGDPEAQRLMAEVERVFQECNKIRECCDRHRRALTAKPAGWQFVGDGDADFMAQLLGWMIPRSARQQIPKHGKEPLIFPNAIAEAMHYRLLGGTGYMRLWLPERYENAAEPWQRVALHSPHPDAVEVELDGDGLEQRITYSYRVGNATYKEVQELDGAATVFRTLDADGAIVPDSETRLDLGGRFTIVKVQGNPIVTRAVKRLQNGLNYILTLMARNLVYGGFLRDVIINGLPPGEYDQSGNYVPDPNGWQEGPGLKLELNGLPIYDSEGNVSGYTTPAIATRDPVPVQTFLDSFKATVTLLYEAFGQAHILNSDIAVSGVSRQQMRQDFSLALAEDAASLRVALADLYAAAYLLARPGPPVALVVTPALAVSEPTPDELRSAIDLHSAGLASDRTSMTRTGIENPDEELDQIERERAARLAAIPRDRTADLEGTEDSEVDDDEGDTDE